MDELRRRVLALSRVPAGEVDDTRFEKMWTWIDRVCRNGADSWLQQQQQFTGGRQKQLSGVAVFSPHQSVNVVQVLCDAGLLESLQRGVQATDSRVVTLCLRALGCVLGVKEALQVVVQRAPALLDAVRAHVELDVPRDVHKSFEKEIAERKLYGALCALYGAASTPPGAHLILEGRCGDAIGTLRTCLRSDSLYVRAAAGQLLLRLHDTVPDAAPVHALLDSLVFTPQHAQTLDPQTQRSLVELLGVASSQSPALVARVKLTDWALAAVGGADWTMADRACDSLRLTLRCTPSALTPALAQTCLDLLAAPGSQRLGLRLSHGIADAVAVNAALFPICERVFARVAAMLPTSRTFHVPRALAKFASALVGSTSAHVLDAVAEAAWALAFNTTAELRFATHAMLVDARLDLVRALGWQRFPNAVSALADKLQDRLALRPVVEHLFALLWSLPTPPPRPQLAQIVTNLQQSMASELSAVQALESFFRRHQDWSAAATPWIWQAGCELGVLSSLAQAALTPSDLHVEALAALNTCLAEDVSVDSSSLPLESLVTACLGQWATSDEGPQRTEAVRLLHELLKRPAARPRVAQLVVEHSAFPACLVALQEDVEYEVKVQLVRVLGSFLHGAIASSCGASEAVCQGVAAAALLQAFLSSPDRLVRVTTCETLHVLLPLRPHALLTGVRASTSEVAAIAQASSIQAVYGDETDDFPADVGMESTMECY